MFLSNAGKRGNAKKNFLYDRKGPWPQPSPTEPLGTAPEVLHLPSEEQWEWRLKIGLRYVKDMLVCAPGAAWRALEFEALPEISDEGLASVLSRGLYSRFLVDLDPPDVALFAGRYDPADGAKYYKTDFNPIASVRPYSGMFVSPTLTLVRRDGDAFEVLAIAVGEDKLVLTPEDGSAWELAKYYLLQGCSYATLFTKHPNVHFPYDTINAVTKGSIPIDHLLFQLLIPHLQFSLVLDNAVLQSSSSVISNYRHTLYDPFTARANDGLMSFFVAGYKGQEGNSAYPAYKYPANKGELSLAPTEYGDFLLAYFEPFLTFTTKVVAEINEDELGYCEEWARWIRTWIPSFPELTFRHGVDEDVVQESRDKLAFALAVMIWDVTVVHSADHEDFAKDVPVEWKCFRLRVAPPAEPGGPALDRSDLSMKIDLFKSYLAHRMFFAPTNVTTLMKTKYAFDSDSLRQATLTFFEQLRAVDAALDDRGIRRFIALEDIAASIQY